MTRRVTRRGSHRAPRLVLAALVLSACGGRHIPLADCHRVAPSLFGPEDFVLDEVSADPRLLISSRATRSNEPDWNNGIWALHLPTAAEPEPTPIPLDVIDGSSHCAVVGPHGIALARMPGEPRLHLFVINDHSCADEPSPDGEPQVATHPCHCLRDQQRFSIERYRVEADHLVFEERYASDLLRRPNDVEVSADGGEIYVSNAGVCGNFLRAVPTGANHAKWTIVAEGMGYANGIALDEERNRLYVAESLHDQVRVYEIDRGKNRTEDSLRQVGRIDLGSGPDNLNWADASKKRLYVAAYPHPLLIGVNYFLHGKSPSEVYVVDNLETAPTPYPIYGDDGGEISSASSALRVGDRLYIGDASDPGLLSCRYPENPLAARGVEAR